MHRRTTILAALPQPRHATSAAADVAASHRAVNGAILPINGSRTHACAISTGALAVFRAFQHAQSAWRAIACGCLARLQRSFACVHFRVQEVKSLIFKCATLTFCRRLAHRQRLVHGYRGVGSSNPNSSQLLMIFLTGWPAVHPMRVRAGGRARYWYASRRGGAGGMHACRAAAMHVCSASLLGRGGLARPPACAGRGGHPRRVPGCVPIRPAGMDGMEVAALGAAAALACFSCARQPATPTVPQVCRLFLSCPLTWLGGPAPLWCFLGTFVAEFLPILRCVWEAGEYRVYHFHGFRRTGGEPRACALASRARGSRPLVKRKGTPSSTSIRWQANAGRSDPARLSQRHLISETG
jgi:hypothetical protein